MNNENTTDTPLMARIRLGCIECGDCLIWQGKLHRDGVPLLHIEGNKHAFSVRRLWLTEQGTNVAGLVVPSTCGNLQCISHAAPMTRAQLQRLTTRLRAPQKQPGSIKSHQVAAARFRKLTPEQVADVRGSNLTQKALAQKHGVCLATISGVRLHKRYREVSSPFAMMVEALR